jgi:hypothetical protein
MVVGTTAGTAIAYVGETMIQQEPGPEPAYHLAHDQHDLIGGAIYYGFAGAALAAVMAPEAFRYLRHRF